MLCDVLKSFPGPGSVRLVPGGPLVETETWVPRSVQGLIKRGYLRPVDAPIPLEDLTKRERILAMLETGETDLVTIAQGVGCSTNYVRVLRAAFTGKASEAVPA